MILQMATIALAIFVVVTSTAISAMELRKTKGGHQEERMEENRKATVTVLILGALFCFFNITYAVGGCYWTYYFVTGILNIPLVLSDILYTLVIPLNSALNPAVYFIRKQAMRAYVRDMLETCY